MAAPDPIRVLLVDDQQLLTDSLARLLAAEPDIEVVGVAATVAEARAHARERMDVVLMDYRLPDGTGAEATRSNKARWPTARVVERTPERPSIEPLTARELEVLRALADGLSTPDICDRLFISPNTLRTHVQNIMTKLHVHSKLEAVTVAVRLRIIEPPRNDDRLY